MSKFVLSIWYVFGLSCCLVLHGCARHSPFASGTIVDLTHTFDTETIYWPTAAGFELDIESNEFTEKIIEAVRRWNPYKSVVVHTIGLGKDLNKAFLEQLAHDNGGRFVQPK